MSNSPLPATFEGLYAYACNLPLPAAFEEFCAYVSNLPLPTTLREFCTYASMIPLRLTQIETTYRPVVESGNGAAEAVSAAYERIEKIEGCFHAAVQMVVHRYEKHLKLDTIRSDIRAVSNAVAELCRLTIDSVQYPDSHATRAAGLKCSRELERAVNVVSELSLLSTPNAESDKHGSEAYSVPTASGSGRASGAPATADNESPAAYVAKADAPNTGNTSRTPAAPAPAAEPATPVTLLTGAEQLGAPTVHTADPLQAPATEAAQPLAATGDVFLSVSQLCRRYKISDSNTAKVEKRLERARKANPPMIKFADVQTRDLSRRNEARILYRESAALPFIKDLIPDSAGQTP